MRRTPPLVLLLSASVSCGGEDTVHLVPAWPSDAAGVIVLIDSAGSPLEASPVLVPPGSGAVRVPVHASSPIRIYARAYPTGAGVSSEEDVVGCGVTHGGAGDPLERPSAAWATAGPIDLGSLTEVVLEPESPPTAFDLRFKSAACASRCPPIEVRRLPAPWGIRAIATVSDDDAIAGGKPHPELAALVHIHAATAERLPPDASLRGAISALVWNPIRRGFVGVLTATTAGKETSLFELDATGSLSALRSVAGIRGIDAAQDGTVLGFTADGLFDPASDPVVATGWAGLTPPIELMTIPSSRRRIAIDATRLWYSDLSFNFEPEYQLRDIDSLRAVDATADTAVAVGLRQRILVRDEVGEAHAWISPSADAPFEGFGVDLKSVAALDRGRFVVAGDGGSAALWDPSRQRWCVIDTGVRFKIDVAAATASKRVVFLAGSDGDTIVELRLGGP